MWTVSRLCPGVLADPVPSSSPASELNGSPGAREAFALYEHSRYWTVGRNTKANDVGGVRRIAAHVPRGGVCECCPETSVERPLFAHGVLNDEAIGDHGV